MIEHYKRQEERAGKRAGGEEDYDEGLVFLSMPTMNAIRKRVDRLRVLALTLGIPFKTNTCNQ